MEQEVEEIMVRDGYKYEIVRTDVKPAIKPGTIFKIGKIDVVVTANNVLDTDAYLYGYGEKTTCRGCVFCNTETQKCFGHGCFGTEYTCKIEEIRNEAFGIKEKCLGFIFKKKLLIKTK